jgi:hypothetical protein
VRRIATSVIAVLLLAGPVAGCGGSDETTDAAPAELGPADVRANLEDAGYVLGEDITDGANLSLPPKGEIDADLYLGVDYDPEQNRMYAGIYFFSDPADAQTVAKAFSDSLTEVRDTRLYNLADEDQAILDDLVATAEGE